MGVSPRGGRVILPQEVEEAKLFLDAAQLDGPSLPAAIRGQADTELRALRAMVDRTAPPDSVSLRAASLVQRIAASVGGALDPFPVRPVALARGAAVYREQCTQCHGPAGRGDGPKAKGLVGPPPSDLSARADLASVSPVDMYRKIAIGIEGTGMPEYAHSLSSDDRWAVTTYVGTFRANPGTVLEGEGLYATQCASCHGASGRGDGTLARTLSVSPPALADLAVQGRLSDDDLTQLILGGRAGTPMPGFARVLDRAAAEKVVAFLRVLPAQERQQGQPSAGSMVFNDVRRQLDSAVALRSAKAAFAAYFTFEQVETEVRARNAALASEIEAGFGTLRGRAAAGASGAELDTIHARLLSGLERAERLVADKMSATKLFVESFVLMLREGFEAILIVGALMTFLTRAGATERRRDVAKGAWAAVGASIVTAVAIEMLFSITPGQREALEGGTMLLAAAVLFYVSYWLLSKIEVAKWNAFVKARLEGAISTGSSLTLASVAFLAVYREGFETILFYKALLTSAGGGGTAAVAGGMALGAVALVAVYFAITQFGLRIPLRPFFAVTSAMLYYMAFVFAGKGVAAFQEGGMVRTTVLEWAPRIPVFGIYPTAESLALQGLLVALLLFAIVWLQRRRLVGA